MPNDVVDGDALDTLEPAELLQPTLDIQSQFSHYNKKHFSNRIRNTTVEYSTRMTLCAGTCTFRPPNVRIGLSEPLLKFRPRSDLLSTLLHEMIHAYLFLTAGLSRDGPDGHGPVFMSHARRINAAERGVIITPYHEFRAEVEHYRVHHWRCEKCQNVIKRAMNRPPGPADQFWPYHQQHCSGEYVKIAGPPKKEKPSRPPKNRAVAVGAKGGGEVPSGVMKTFRIDKMLSGRMRKKPVVMASCPVCAVSVKQDEMNQHLDACLAEGIFTQPANPPPSQPQRPPPRQQTKMATVQTTPPTKPVAIRKPVPLPEGGSCPAPATSMRDQNPQRPNGPINNSYLTTSRDPYDVMQYIADPEALYSLALAPKKFHPEQVDKIFRDLPSHVPEPSLPIPANGIKGFLQLLIHPESPSSKEQQAKAIINPLMLGPRGEEFSFRVLSERWSMSRSDILELIQQNSSTDEHGNTVLSAQLMQMFYSRDPPNTKPKKSSKRSRSSTAALEEHGNQPDRKPRRGSKEIRPGSRDRFQTEADGRQRGEDRSPKRRARANICPLCDQNVGKGRLEEHISICMVGSQGLEGDNTAEIRSGESRNVPPPTAAVAQTGSRLSDTTSEKSQRCPICDVPLSRQDLEAHIPTCMMSTGLADAF